VSAFDPLNLPFRSIILIAMFSFHLPELEPNEARVLVAMPELVHQMNRVLRFRGGEEVFFLDGKGQRVHARLESLTKREADFVVLKREFQSAPKRRVTLAFGIPKKPATLEWMLEKATELGVDALQPVVTQHGQVDRIPKPDRLRSIVKEACEQSERWFFPELLEPVSFESALASSAVMLAGDARRGVPFSTVADRTLESDVLLLIGPEGGFSEEELAMVESKGGTVVRLGETVLRVETAALAFLSLIRYHSAD